MMEVTEENIGPGWFLSEVTGISKEEILETALCRVGCLVEQGEIRMLRTPFGNFLVLDHPLLRERTEVIRKHENSVEHATTAVLAAGVGRRRDGMLTVTCPHCGVSVARTPSYIAMHTLQCPHCLKRYKAMVSDSD